MSTRVVVADDQEIVRTGLTMLLNTQPEIEVVGEAADGRRAVELARRLRPDVCLFDIRMPGMDGIEATRSLAGPAVDDPLAVVVITTFDLDELYITLSTVKTHITSLMTKLGARNRVEVAIWAYETGRVRAGTGPYYRIRRHYPGRVRPKYGRVPALAAGAIPACAPMRCAGGAPTIEP